MGKTYRIDVVRSTIMELHSEQEAEKIADMLSSREPEQFAGNLVFITTNVKELTNA